MEKTFLRRPLIGSPAQPRPILKWANPHSGDRFIKQSMLPVCLRPGRCRWQAAAGQQQASVSRAGIKLNYLLLPGKGYANLGHYVPKF
jgi:hypothetical protein